MYDETVQEAGFGHSGIAGAPKVLGDIVEALAAAVYLDSGRDLDLTWRVSCPYINIVVATCVCLCIHVKGQLAEVETCNGNAGYSVGLLRRILQASALVVRAYIPFSLAGMHPWH